MATKEELLEKVETLQNLLVSFATGGQANLEDYRLLRRELMDEPTIRDQLPRFVRTCRDLHQFWQFIKREYSTYQERRAYLWGQFNPIIDMLESRVSTPSDESITETIAEIDSDTIHEAWRRALERRFDDADGAITAARSLVETVCKHILDEAGIDYSDNPSLPKLYRRTAKTLELAPSQQPNGILKQIFGGITAVIEGLGALRNILGDAHGKGKEGLRPEVHHAELAVNLAGAVATFLIDTWNQQKIGSKQQANS